MIGCDRKYKTAKANIKDYLMTKGIISNKSVGGFHDLRIKKSQIDHFNAVAIELKRIGLEEYGITPNYWIVRNGQYIMWNEGALKAVDRANGVERNDHVYEEYYYQQHQSFLAANAREELEQEAIKKGAKQKVWQEKMNHIDESGDSKVFSPAQEDPFFFESSDVFASQVDAQTAGQDKSQGLNRLIKLKQKLLANAKAELAQINADLKEAKADANKHKELLRQRAKVKAYIDGTEDYRGLEEEIEDLKKIDTRSPELIAPYIKKELARLQTLVVSNRAEDMKEARDIIEFIKAMSNFELNDAKSHPIYDYDEMFDEDKNFMLSEEITKPFIEWAAEATRLGSKLQKQEQQFIEDVFNNNENVRKMMGGKKLSYHDIILAQNGLRDAHWVDMMVMDITAGIFSHNGMLPQIAKKIVDDGLEIAFTWSKSVATRLDAMMPEVEAEIEKLDGGKYKLSALGILVKGFSYDWLKQVYKNGLQTGNMASKYSAEWYDTLSAMRAAFYANKKSATRITDWADRLSAMRTAYEKRRTWLNKHTVMMDFTKIQSIVQDTELASLFSGNTTTQQEMADYEKELIAMVGKRYYDKLVEEQKNLLKEYKIQRQEEIERLQAESGVAAGGTLYPAEAAALEIWEAIHNPFLTKEYMETGEPMDNLVREFYPEMMYNVYIPKKEVDGKKTDFYDSNYEKIEENETLMKFYDLALEATTRIKEQFDLDTQKTMLDTSVPFIEKSMMELLLDNGDMTFWQAISEVFRQFIDRIKMVWGVNIEDQFNYAKVNVITGQPEYFVNDQFIKKGQNQINENFLLNKTGFVQAYRALTKKHLSQFTKLTILNLTPKNAETMAQLLSPYIKGITGARLLELYPDKKIPAGKIVYAYSQHQVAQEKSFDLPKIIRHFSDMSAQYAARKTMLPMLELMKRHYEKIKAPATQNTDQAIVNAGIGNSGEDETQFNGYRTHANRQFDNWFRRVVLGDYGLKKHYGFLRHREEDDPNGTAEEDFLSKLFAKVLPGKFDGKVMTYKDKALAAKIDTLLKTEKDPKVVESLEGLKNSLGRDASLSGFMENVLNFLRFKSLGFNVSSAVTNIVEGQIANTVMAQIGYFPAHYMDTISFGEIMHYDAMSKINPDRASKKIRKYKVLLDRWDILQDSRNELQKASAKSSFGGLSRLDPYYMQSKGEYYNQMPILAAVLRDTPIFDKDGNESNVGDAIEVLDNGVIRLKDEFREGPVGQENIANWENADGKKYRDFKSRIKDIIKNTHGDYDKTSGMMAKSSHTGLVVMMFKTWLPREFYKRFATEQDNILSGVKGFKGRYHSHSMATGLVLGAGIALVPFGVVGATAFGAVGAYLGRNHGSKNLLSFTQEMLFLGKILLRKVLGFPINFTAKTLTGKKLFETDIDKLAPDGLKTFTKDFTERDYANWKANVQEIAILLMFIGLLLLTKAMFWDDDDEEDSARRQAHNLFANRFIQLSSSIGQYSNPVESYQTMTNISLLKFLKDGMKLVGDLDKTLEGEGRLTTGPDVGEFRAVMQAKKVFLPNLVAHPFNLGFESHMQKQFIPVAVDSWFFSEEKKAKQAVSQIRAEAKLEQGENYNKKEYAKKKGESYTELLKRLSTPRFDQN